MPISSSSASSYALDLVPISPRNSNPSSSHAGAMHFATRTRQSRHNPHRNGSSMAEEFASYSRTDAQMQDAARDHGLRHMVAAVERMKGPEVKRSKSTTIRWCQALVTNPAFDMLFAVLVALNTIFMGIDVELELADQVHHGESVVLSVIRRIFTVAFTVELVLRIFAHGWDFFCRMNFWNWLDTVIVVAGLVETVFAVIQAADGTNAPSMLSLRALRILRITRMLKIIRVLRIFRFVLALRTLVQSTIHTLKSLFWALVLLGLIIYVFALVFTEVTADMIRNLRANGADGEEQSDSLKYFGSVTTTMLSLFMSISGGVSWEDVLAPLRRVSEIWVVLFIMYVSFTYFAVLNVMTAVFCQSAIDSAQSDHSTKCQAILADKEMHIEKIKDLFQEIDEERTGIITYQTFQRKMNSPEVRTYFETIDLDVWDAWSFFKLLDLDEGGSVEIEEFLMGCLRLRGSARSMDVAKLMYDQAWHIKNQGRFWAFVEERLRMLQEEVSSSTAK